MKTQQYDKKLKKWMYDFVYEGKRYRKKGFKTKREAEYAGNEKFNELTKGLYLDNDLSFYDYFKNWCETFKQPNVTPITYKSYKAAIKHIGNHSFSQTSLKSLTRNMYQQFINEFSKTHSKETIRKLNGYIRSSLDDAVYEGLLPKNITYKVTFKGSNPPKDEQSKFINLVEYETLKQYFKSQNNRSSLALFIMICTGCRISGVLNMKYQYINQVKNELFIDERKNDVSPRTLTIAKDDMRHITGMIEKLKLNTKGLLFNSFGTTLTINAVNKQLKQACKLHDIKEITSHALRHTHCSYLLANDVSIYYISKRLGHKNISVTTEIYSHLLEEKYLEENNKAIEILSAM